MRNPLLVSLVIAAFALAAPRGARSQETPAASRPRIVTTGTGEAHVTPDRATLMLGVQSRAATATAAGADNARRQRAVLDTLRALGLTSAELSTLNYSVAPEMQYPQNGGTPRVTGYVVTNTVRAEIKRIEDAGRLIDAALAKGANEVSSLQFYSSKADSARRAALATAVSNARADAEAVARASGGSLGPVIEISTSGGPIRPLEVGPRMALSAKAAPTPIEPGEQTVTATVSAEFTFIPR